MNDHGSLRILEGASTGVERIFLCPRGPGEMLAPSREASGRVVAEACR